MAATGELIRLINYVDDINTTLRRISASIPLMDADERKRPKTCAAPVPISTAS